MQSKSFLVRSIVIALVVHILIWLGIFVDSNNWWPQHSPYKEPKIIIRLKNLDLINSKQYELFSQLKIKQTAKGYGFDLSLYEPGNEGLVIGDYGIRAKQLFSEMKISESHYYELMNSIGIDPTADTHEE